MLMFSAAPDYTTRGPRATTVAYATGVMLLISGISGQQPASARAEGEREEKEKGNPRGGYLGPLWWCVSELAQRGRLLSMSSQFVHHTKKRQRALGKRLFLLNRFVGFLQTNQEAAPCRGEAAALTVRWLPRAQS